MKLQKILDWLKEQGYKYTFKGDDQIEIEGFSSLSNYNEGTLTWIKKSENYNSMNKRGDISCAVVPGGLNADLDNMIITDHSKEVFFAVLHEFWGEKRQEGAIGEGTVISEKALIDPTAVIGCNCSIIGEIIIGAHTVIEHNVVIQGKVHIGERCYIQSSAVIGIDGYGYSQEPVTKRKKMIEHFGGVSIGDDVFIGSHVNIARGTINDTVIASGVKIAPSTHIGHNNIIEADTAVICSALYGSVKIGRGSYITSSIVKNQVAVGCNTVIGMGSVVTKPVADNMIAYGIPARNIKENDSGL